MLKASAADASKSWSLRVQLDEARVAQLAARNEQVRERLEPVAVGLERGLVRFLGRVHAAPPAVSSRRTASLTSV